MWSIGLYPSLFLTHNDWFCCCCCCCLFVCFVVVVFVGFLFVCFCLCDGVVAVVVCLFDVFLEKLADKWREKNNATNKIKHD